MPCSCSNKSAPFGWIVTKPDSTTIPYRTEVEAAAAAQRTGGTYTRAKAPVPA